MSGILSDPVSGPCRECRDRERWVRRALRRQDTPIADEEVRDIPTPAPLVDYRVIGRGSHPATPDEVREPLDPSRLVCTRRTEHLLCARDPGRHHFSIVLEEAEMDIGHGDPELIDELWMYLDPVPRIGRYLAEDPDRGVMVVVLHRREEFRAEGARFLRDQMRHRDRQGGHTLQGVAAHEVVLRIGLVELFRHRTGGWRLILSDHLIEPTPDHGARLGHQVLAYEPTRVRKPIGDRKSTRLNSSHV